MKLQLFLAAMLIGSTMAMSAQDVYSENFERTPNDIINDGWRFKELVGDPENYGVFSTSPSIQAIGIEGGSMGSTSFNMINNIPTPVQGVDLAIVTPTITLPSGESHFHYRMGSVRISGAATSTYSLYVMTASEFETVAASPSQLKSLLDSKMADDSATLAHEIVDNTAELTDFEGEDIVIVFRMHNSPGNNILLFDNLRVTGGALGNDEFNPNSFAIYPNPASDIVTIASAENLFIEGVKVTDINGRTVINRQFANPATAQLDLSGLGSGVYMISVSSDKGVATKKIVKQ